MNIDITGKGICYILLIISALIVTGILIKGIIMAWDGKAFWLAVNPLAPYMLLAISGAIGIIGYMLINKWIKGDVLLIDKLGSMFVAIGVTVFASALSDVLKIYERLKKAGLIKWYLAIFFVALLVVSFVCILCLDNYISVSEFMIVLIGIIVTIMFDCSKEVEKERVK